jgi:hypothetical protein
MRRGVGVVAERQKMSPEIHGNVLGLRSKSMLHLAGSFGFTDKMSAIKMVSPLSIGLLPQAIPEAEVTWETIVGQVASIRLA